MSVIQIRKGKDIKLKGYAQKKIVEISLPKNVALQPPDFRGIKAKVIAKPDTFVQVGTPVIEDKNHPEIKIVSPVSGKVTAVNRGNQRVLLQVVIEPDGKQDAISFRTFSTQDIEKESRHNIIKHLLDTGLWPHLRQRPFSKIAHPTDTPKAIFVQAMNTEPLALDVDFILNNREEEFQAGLNVLKKLTPGKVHVCTGPNVQSKALTESQGVEIHQFVGPHPAGNVSTHIHFIDPIKKGDLVWYLRAEDVVRIGTTFLKGKYSPERIVALTGEGSAKRIYAKTVIGVPIAHLLDGNTPAGIRYISGSVLSGTNAGVKGALSFYDTQVSAIPEGGERKFLGWMSPGLHEYSFSKTFLSSFLGGAEREASLNTDKNGSDRAIVFNHIYDKYVPIDVMTYFLVRAVIGGDIEEAEKLGILECDEEDFALSTFACPSKFDVGAVIRQGLDIIEKEG